MYDQMVVIQRIRREFTQIYQANMPTLCTNYGAIYLGAETWPTL